MPFLEHFEGKEKSEKERAPERVLMGDDRFAVVVRGGATIKGSAFVQTKVRVFGPDGKGAADFTVNQLTRLVRAVPELDAAIPDVIGSASADAEARLGEKPADPESARRMASETADAIRRTYSLEE